MSESLDPYRLPRTVLPTRCELTVEPDLQTARFSGGVRIAVEVVEPVQVVWLNAADLAITAAVMEDAAGSSGLGPRSRCTRLRSACSVTAARSCPPGLRVKKDVSEVHHVIAPRQGYQPYPTKTFSVVYCTPSCVSAVESGTPYFCFLRTI